jgi:hypothetical protein
MGSLSFNIKKLNMIQLQYSASGISNKTVYIGTKYTGSLLRLQLTSSFSGDISNLTPTIISNKSNEYGGWIMYEVNNATIPTDSGQYFVNIYETDGSGGNTWIAATSTWDDEMETWSGYTGDLVLGNLLSQDRALVSGSDYDPIYKHQYQEESNFTVYNG